MPPPGRTCRLRRTVTPRPRQDRRHSPYGRLLPAALERGRAALEAFDAWAEPFGQLSGNGDRPRGDTPVTKSFAFAGLFNGRGAEI
jgi:hypothetical protein